MSMASFPKTPVWCAGVRDYYDGDLLDQISKPPFEELSNPRPWEQKTGRAADPPPDFKPHSGADDSEEESTFLAIGTEDINGTPLTFVEVTTGESCSAATHIEMWSSDLKHYLGNGEDALKHLADRGDNARLVRIQGKQYLIQEHYHWRPDEIEVIGFAKNLTPRLMCRVILQDSDPERIESALDHELCEAVRTDHVEEVAMNDLKGHTLSRADFGTIPLQFDERDANYEFFKAGSIDLANDGKAIAVAMARSSGESPMGCDVANLTWEWPVVLRSDGAPDRKSKLNLVSSKAGNQSSRLIQYRGKVYIDSHSLRDEKESTHTVSSISASGIQTICRFNPIQYIIKSLSSKK